MSDADRLTVTLVIVTAASTLTAAMVGVLVAEWLAGHRRQRAAIQQVRRALATFRVANAASHNYWPTPADSIRGIRLSDYGHESAAALHDVDVTASELPRRVRQLINDAVTVLQERVFVANRADCGTDDVVRAVIETADSALREISESSLLRWWFFRRWGTAEASPEVQGYIAAAAALHAEAEEMQRAEQARRAERDAQPSDFEASN